MYDKKAINSLIYYFLQNCCLDNMHYDEKVFLQLVHVQKLNMDEQ